MCPEGSKIQAWNFGKRAFTVYGPPAWNCLPREIRLCDETEVFKWNLKTCLFVKFVNESSLAIWFWRIIVKHPRMLLAQFVVLYKPCKPKPILWCICFQARLWIDSSIEALMLIDTIMRVVIDCGCYDLSRDGVMGTEGKRNTSHVHTWSWYLPGITKKLCFFKCFKIDAGETWFFQRLLEKLAISDIDDSKSCNGSVKAIKVLNLFELIKWHFSKWFRYHATLSIKSLQEGHLMESLFSSFLILSVSHYSDITWATWCLNSVSVI